MPHSFLAMIFDTLYVSCSSKQLIKPCTWLSWKVADSLYLILSTQDIQKLDETDATPGTYVRMEEPLPYKDVALVDPSDK